MTPSQSDPNVIDLIDPSGTAHYKKHRVPGPMYKMDVYDPLSEGLLATATAPSASSKHKTIQLHNPEMVVELKYTGTISFKWRFKWEDHEFEWKREECYILRKPDPAVLVAVTKEPPGKIKTSTVQILDYNLNRFDIQDRKGLEIVLLTALLTFQDTNDAYHTPAVTPPALPIATKPSTPGSPTGAVAAAGMGAVAGASAMPGPSELANVPSQRGDAPNIPPKPAPKAGVARIAEQHMLRTIQGEGEANEIEVAMEGTIDDYAQYAEKLLQDDAMLFITLRSASAQQVPKVLAVVEQTKRRRHKAGLDENESLFQYVVYDAPSSKQKGPKRINLDDPSPKKGYAPPQSLIVHISKIDMPELQPRVDPDQLNRAHSKVGTNKPPPPSIPSGKPAGGSSKPTGSSSKPNGGKTGGMFGMFEDMSLSGKKDKKEKDKKDSHRPTAPALNSHTRPGSTHRPNLSTSSYTPPTNYPSSSPLPFFPAPTGFSGPPPPSPHPPHSPYGAPPAPHFGPPPTHPYHAGGEAASYFNAPNAPPHGGSPYGGGYNPSYM